MIDNIRQTPAWDLLPPRPIMVGYRGSISHGTYRGGPESVDDIDIMSTHVGPLEHYLGFRRKGQETVDRMEGKWDVVSHEVRKFVGLLKGNNPNVMDLLWLPRDMVLYSTREGEYLRQHKRMFLSKQAYHAFNGYAHSQYEDLQKDTYKGYMGEKRKNLADRHGYDVKHASHLIRLLRMGIEFLSEGRITLPRPDADELLEIKEGEWSLREVKQVADNLFDGLDRAHKNSDLPEHPHTDIEQVLVEIIMSYHNLR